MFENVYKRPPENIDVMFVEGTTIERNKAKYADEKDVENKLVELFKSQNNSSFILGFIFEMLIFVRNIFQFKVCCRVRLKIFDIFFVPCNTYSINKRNIR